MKNRYETYEIEDKKEEYQRGCLSFALLIVFALFLVMVGAVSPKETSPKYVEHVFCIKKDPQGKAIFALIDTFKKEELEGLGFQCITRKITLSMWHYIYLQALKHEIDIERALSPKE